jgi:hypothetical protein
MQPVFFMDELLSATGTLGNVPVVYFSCVSNQVRIAPKLFLAVLTSVVIPIEKIQSDLICHYNIKKVLSLLA